MDTTVLDRKAAQLVAASQRQSFDPFTEIDWDLPLDDSTYHLPPEFLPLYGTPQWEAMTESERRTYSRHETAALCGAGIWFENLLMQVVLRHLAEMPATDPSHRFLLVEVADECRHSMMFGEYIRRAGTPAYSPADKGGFLDGPAAALEGTPVGRVLSYLLILSVEELLDVCNRATMKDERCNAVSRQIARIHVLEEARHVSFARTYLSGAYPALAEEEQQQVAMMARFAVAATAQLFVNPQVYEELGIDGGAAAAHTSPHHRARITRDLTRLTDFLAELGVITDGNRPDWQALGLVAAA